MSDLKLNKTRTDVAGGHGVIDSVQRPDLVTLVTESIRQRVLDGTYTTGHVLPAEADLAKAFEVSRNVMREAMRNLRVLGLVEVTQGRRPRVRGISTEASINALGTLLSRCEATLEELMAARMPLEVQVVALLARGAQVPDLTKAAQANRDMNLSCDHQAWCDADQVFHRSLAKATGNQVLVTIIETVADLTFKLRTDALLLAGSSDWPFAEQLRARGLAEHNLILEAIERRDEEAARSVMLEHMEGVVSTLQKMEEALESGCVSDGNGAS